MAGLASLVDKDTEECIANEAVPPVFSGGHTDAVSAVHTGESTDYFISAGRDRRGELSC